MFYPPPKVAVPPALPPKQTESKTMPRKLARTLENASPLWFRLGKKAMTLFEASST
jgi:hypothetical protein